MENYNISTIEDMLGILYGHYREETQQPVALSAYIYVSVESSNNNFILSAYKVVTANISKKYVCFHIIHRLL